MGQRLQGVVERLSYTNSETGYTVARFLIEGEKSSITIVGKFAGLQVGVTLIIEGDYTCHPKWGDQFQVETYTEGAPVTTEGIEKYLGSGMIKGIGPVMASRIVAKFGTATLDILDQNIEWLAQVPGIGAAKIASVKEAWEKQKDIKVVMVFLQSYGVSTGFAVKIYKKWGRTAIAVVKKNPYILTEIRGVGFLSADAIARNLGVVPSSPYRIRAGIEHVLSTAAGDGHCFLPGPELTKRAVDLLKVEQDNFVMPPNLIWQEMQQMVADQKLIGQESQKKPGLFAYYLPPFYYAEMGLANNIKRLLSNPLQVDMKFVETWMDDFMASSGMPLSDEQQFAVKTAATKRVGCLVGGPGCGKTFSAKAIISLWKAQGKSIALAAPTGRAAQRLAEMTGREASTIHRLLEYREHGFLRDEKNPLEVDAVLIDEVSMLDVFLGNALFAAINPTKTQIVLVGDSAQLASVGAGSVLGDLMRSGVVPVTHLTQIFRQAAESAIIRHAHTINKGIVPGFDYLSKSSPDLPSDCLFIPVEEPEKGFDVIRRLVETQLPGWGFPEDRVQILCPQVKGMVGTKNLNKEMQPIINPPHPEKAEVQSGDVLYRVGDRVIQKVNDYDRAVFNGELGLIHHIDLEEDEITVQFEDGSGEHRDVKYDRADWDEFYHATAISGHKAQGSQFDAIIIPMFTSAYMLLTRNWFYTTLTRAKKLAIIVGQPKAVGIAVSQNRDNKRFTYLSQRLQEVEAAAPLFQIS